MTHAMISGVEQLTKAVYCAANSHPENVRRQQHPEDLAARPQRHPGADQQEEPAREQRSPRAARQQANAAVAASAELQQVRS
jgi:hypothetical protein